MRLLAIDTALAACSAAIYDTEVGLIAAESRPMARGHAEALMPLIAKLMSDAKAKFSELDRIAVTVGPGSFTGLRVGIAAARGIALTSGKPAVGVTTLAAFAAPHAGREDATPILAVIDARNDNVYMQVFGSDAVSREPPRIATLTQAIEAVAPGPVLVVGSGAPFVAASWPGWMPPDWIKTSVAPDIEWVARLGADADASVRPPRPLYLRDPNYKPQDGALARQ
jgi:tRNA threonylcarbamoyl adenosine modification protein YeaZ